MFGELVNRDPILSLSHDAVSVIWDRFNPSSAIRLRSALSTGSAKTGVAKASPVEAILTSSFKACRLVIISSNFRKSRSSRGSAPTYAIRTQTLPGSAQAPHVAPKDSRLKLEIYSYA